MAKKKKFGVSLKRQVDLLPIVKEKAPKTISTNVSTGGMRSAVSGTTQSVAKSARQKAEEERSARMRQGLSSVVRSSFNRQMSRPTYINKNTVNRLNQLNKTVTNPLAPIKQKQATGGNGVGGQRLFSKERSLLNNTKFVTGGQGVGGKTVTYSPIGRAKSSVLAPIKEDIQNNPYDAVRKVGMKGSRNERRVYVPMSQRDENGQISTNQRRLENAARGGNRKAAVEAALARTKAQTRSGHTYDQYVNAELNRRGLLGQDYILRGKDPSQEAIDYRNKYGFDEEALNQIKAIADNAPASGDYNERFNGQDNGSVLDRIKFGLDESWRARNIEDTYKRMYGKSVDDDTQAKLDAVRDSGGYMVGNMLGQASQFAMTAPYSGVLEGSLMARMGLKGGRAAINTTADALKYAGARIGADQILSAPINLLDAMKEDNAKDIVKRFGLNTGMDIVFSGLLEIPSLRANSKFVKAVRANDAANAMEESAEQISAKLAAEKQLSEAISSFNPSEQRAIRERMKQLADDADARREMERAFAGESSADNLGIYNEELPSNLTDYEARRLVDTEPTPNELVRERARNFRNNSEMMFQDGGIASREAVNTSIRHGVQDSDYLNWRLAYDAARRNGMVEDDAIRYADDYVISSAERANLVNREPVDTLAVANEEARRADSLLNAANGRETRDSLLDAANGRENSDALLDAANRRMANEPALVSGGEVPRNNGTFGRDVTAKYNESIEADENLERAIANYDKPLTELSDAESKLWDDTYGEAYRRYSEFPDARQRAIRAADDAVKQRRNIDLAQAASRAEEAQRAINDLHRTPKEEIDLAQNEIRNANNVSDNVTNNAAEPKTSGADYIPVENKGKVYNADEDVYVTRYDNEGATLTDKPQGLYVAHRSTKSPHTDVGEKQYNLIIDKNARFYDTVFDGKLQTNRMSVPIECGTTVNYLVDKMGKDRVEQLLKTDREYLVKALGEEYPNVDWSRYYDNLEMVEAYGGLVARKDGVDVVRTIDKSATSDFDMTELSVLNDSVIREDADIPTGKREPIAEEPTAPREEQVARTEPKRKKVEEPKQTQTPNNNGEVDGSTVYNTNGGINNGAEQKPRSTAKRTVRKVQEQPDSVADAKIGGRRPEERLEGDSGNNRRLLLNDEQEKLFNDNNVARTGIKESDSPSFISNITENSGSQKYGACVDIPTEKHLKETNAKLYSTADGSGTVAVTKDGDIIALSKKRGAQEGTSDELLLTAIAKGGKKMDAFGADLANLYSRYGFEPVGRVEFNPAIYADEPEKLAVFKQLAVDGKEGPDVYVFKHNGDNLETVIKKNRNGEYKSWSQDELDKLPVFEDSVDSASKETIYGYDKALEYRDRLLREQENPKVSAEKSDKEKLFYNAPKPYTPKGGGKDEKAWKAIRKSYEKNSKEQLELKKQQIKKAVSNGTMPKSQGDERIKLIDNILEQREYYRFGTKKEFNGKKISQTVDTGRAAEIPDAVKARIEDNVVAGEAGIKMGQNPKAALRDAKTRVKEDPEAIRIKIDKATPAAREGRLPTGYDNLQEYYAEANALLDHYSEKISDLESKGLTDSDEYKKMIDDTANFVEGVFSTRSQEGYAAVQYNMMVRSNAEVRVAVVERSLRQIEEEYANELEKVAKKNGTPISKDDQIHITLSKESRKRLREVDPDNPLEMAITLHKISVETWNQVPADKHEVADAIRKTSMLLNPKTHLRNVIGNTLMIPARIMKDLLGAPVEKWAIRKGYMRADQATKAFVNRFSRSDKPYYDVARAVWKEWKDVIRGDAKMFDSVPTSASKLIGKRPIGEGRVLTAGIENPKTWRKAVDWIIKKNGSALEASDALMMRIHFTDSFAQVCKARNLDPSKLTKEQLMDVIDAATGEAQRATFRDASEVAKTINGWKVYKKGDTFAQKVGRFSVNTTMPFVNTPINILRRSWDYSPAGFIHGGGEILQGIQKHNAKQVKKGIDRMCSGLTGSGVCLLGFYLGKSGNLTARLSEGSEGYYEQDQGFQEYSLNIGGEDGWSVSLSQFAPHTIPLFMGVELANLFDPNEEVNWKALPDVIGRVFDPTMDMSVMQGPMSVLKSISESDSLGDVPLVAAMTLGTNYISQYIPTLSGQIARAIDPVRRDTSSTQEDKTVKYLEKSWNKTLAKIPYASNTLEPYLDSWGNEQVSIDGNPMQRFLYEVASPSYIRKKNITALDKEITRLNGIAADDEDKIIPKKFFGNTVSFDGGDVQISKADLTTYNKVRGKAAYEAASELIETDAYKNASDAEKRKMIDKVFKDANTKGKQETLLKKGYSASKVYTEGFEGGKKENADKVFSAGVAPKRYYELMTDKSVDLDGNGSKTQYEVYTYLQNTDLTDAQKAAIWNSYNKGWKNNPYAGGTIPTADDSKSGSKSGSNGSKRGRSGRRSSGGGSSKTKARAKTASEKRFAALQTGKAPTNAKGIEALSNGAKGLTKAQKKALVKLMQKKLEV